MDEFLAQESDANRNRNFHGLKICDVVVVSASNSQSFTGLDEVLILCAHWSFSNETTMSELAWYRIAILITPNFTCSQVSKRISRQALIWLARRSAEASTKLLNIFGRIFHERHLFGSFNSSELFSFSLYSRNH